MNSLVTVRQFELFCLVALVATVGLACGSDSGAQDPITVEEFDQQTLDMFVESFCSANYECIAEQNPHLAVFPSLFGDQQTCEAEAREYYASSNLRERGFDVSSDVERGLVEFNPDKAQECLESLEAENRPACDFVAVTVSEDPACRQVVTGVQPAGAPCAADEHCASGRCATNSDLGDVCWTGECEAGTPPEPMVLTSPGAECDGRARLCGEGLTCDTDADLRLRCVSNDSQPEGEPCLRSAICEGGLACLDGACTDLTIVAEGEMCDGETTFCDAGLICGPTSNGGTLTCQTPLAQGQDCYALQSCEVGLFCDMTDGSGTCEPTQTEGEACDVELACSGGLTCDDETETCQVSMYETPCDIPTDQQSM
jgi:hypothetical protein